MSREALSEETDSTSRGFHDRDCHLCRSADASRRPKRVCLCSSLPDVLIRLHGKLVILQHPFESRRRMSTVPMLQLCIDNVIVVRGRRFHESKELEALLQQAEQDSIPVFLLFLADGAVDIGTARQCHEHAQRGRQPAEAVLQEALLYVLLVIDGTWRQAKEMYKELRTWLPASVTLVHLPQREDEQTVPNYLLRSQPDAACMSTMEAVARAVGIMEGEASIEETLLKPLRLMTALQAEFDPSTQTRLQQGLGSCVTGKSFGFKMPGRLLGQEAANAEAQGHPESPTAIRS